VLADPTTRCLVIRVSGNFRCQSTVRTLTCTSNLPYELPSPIKTIIYFPYKLLKRCDIEVSIKYAAQSPRIFRLFTRYVFSSYYFWLYYYIAIFIILLFCYLLKLLLFENILFFGISLFLTPFSASLNIQL